MESFSEIERIEYLIDHEGSAKAFADKIGASKAAVSKLRRGKFRLEVYAARIANAYPHLNCRWLLTGKGNPMTPELSRDALEGRLDELLQKIDGLAQRKR